MSLTSIVVCHGGKWESSTSEYEHYVGYTTVAVTVQKKASYAELLNAICNRLGLNIEMCIITLRFPVPNSYASGMTCLINSDHEALAFWKFNRESKVVPIFVDVENKKSTGHVFEDGIPENAVPQQFQHYISTSDSNTTSASSSIISNVNLHISTSMDFHYSQPRQDLNPIFVENDLSTDVESTQDKGIPYYATTDYGLGTYDLNTIEEDTIDYDVNTGLNDIKKGSGGYFSTGGDDGIAREWEKDALPVNYNLPPNPVQFIPSVLPSDLGASERVLCSGIGDVKIASSSGKFKHENDTSTFTPRNAEILLNQFVNNKILIFSAEELKIATNNYDMQVVKVEYDYKLYEGFLPERPILVMKFDRNKNGAYISYLNNIFYALKLNHTHILKLIGCCLETEIPIIVFESAEFGTLADRIFRPHLKPYLKPLVLTDRLKIAMDVANAVTYLHVGLRRPLLHRWLKSANILFHEEFVAKLFDFSLSVPIPEAKTHVEMYLVDGELRAVGPEVWDTGKVNEKWDVCSFGVILYELLSGKPISDAPFLPPSIIMERHDKVSPMRNYFENNELNEIADPVIVRDYETHPEKEKQVRAFVELMLQCGSKSPEDRPTMVDVAKQLEQVYQSILML